MTRVFVAGVMQGSVDSTSALDLFPQDYRRSIADIARSVLPGVEIVDPDADQHRFGWTQEQQSEYFFRFVAEAAACDVVIAYLPVVSMGTAVELHAAHRAGKTCIVISPLRTNWTINALATIRVSSIAELADALRSLALRKD